VWGAHCISSGLLLCLQGELLGRGACKAVYKAFDESEGVERAWNEVTVAGELFSLDDKEKERIFAEIKLLKQLKHKNVLALYDYWFDKMTSSRACAHWVAVCVCVWGGGVQHYWGGAGRGDGVWQNSVQVGFS
jgi:hypothetical protein